MFFFPFRFHTMQSKLLLNRIVQIKKKRLKKLLIMAAKTKIIWYRLGHGECLKFQIHHSRYYQFQKDLHSLFYHRKAGVNYDPTARSRSNHQNSLPRPNVNTLWTFRYLHKMCTNFFYNLIRKVFWPFLNHRTIA